ncbi:MAG: TIGR01212 family radical SAM protein [Bacteroidaceae bacterium]|nr:TIGR01212 family radical SAM protein [Bacteroidaceae bacterium]
MEKARYNDYGSFLQQHFAGKVQKISINGGFTCPNRDGTVGLGGCSFCNNQTFNPDYCRRELSVTQQLQEGIRFFGRKYPTMRYLAYFQAYTSTYDELPNLIARYEEALSVDGVVGIIIGTRPDCMPQALLDYLTELAKRTFVTVEYGVESTLDSTLQRINRGHNYATAIDAIERTAAANIITGAHLILGLPGETHDDMLQHATRLSQLPLHTIKLHQLQLIRGTVMGKEYEEHPEHFDIPDIDTYIDRAIDFAELLRPDIVIERFVSQSPAELLIAPHWGLKNHEFTARLLRRMRERDTWQGCKWHKNKPTRDTQI